MAIKLNGKNIKAFNVRGIIYDHIENYDNALADYTTAIEIDSKYAKAYVNRGLIY